MSGKVVNVHEREIPVPAARAGALIDTLASNRDALWPVKSWPRMALDRPLAVGASGGHGPIRYVVEDYVPGRLVRFRFTRPRGFEGCHEFEAFGREQGAALLRHTIRMTLHGSTRVSWPLLYRPLHDALLEDSLTEAEASLGVPHHRRPWSAWVRLLRWVMSPGRPVRRPDLGARSRRREGSQRGRRGTRSSGGPWSS